MSNKEQGFTLVEIMMVVVILAILSSIAIPSLLSSARSARENADIATGHQLKTALDRFYVENGHYPTLADFTSEEGSIEAQDFIPEYISKLNPKVTQQQAEEGARGFGVTSLNEDGSLPDENGDYLIMVYLDRSGTRAEVRTFNSDLTKILWSSAD